MKSAIILFLILSLFVLMGCESSEQKALQAPIDFVSIDEVSAKSLNATLIRAGNYILANQDKSGRTEYIYYPDTQTFSTSTHMVRQLMTTYSLYSLYNYTQDQKFKNAYDEHLQYYISNYYQEDPSHDFGYIFYNNQSYLGAASLAFISLSHTDQFSEIRASLLRHILFLHNESDGSFYTFYIPLGKEVDQQFYPGEAMLALMMEYEATKDPMLLQSVQQSFDYYSNYFVGEKKRPAFVPWHTMADYKLYQQTNNDTYADYIFEINDWLVDIMLRDECESPHELGAFYNLDFPEYGIPHSSSTSVYMEGLSYAYKLANERNDVERAQRYKQAMILGSRSLMQMQYREDEIKSRPDKNILLGGMRTSQNISEIRIDNNQHSIMALLVMLSVLSEDEIREFIESNPQYGCSG